MTNDSNQTSTSADETFECAQCGEQKPIALRERVGWLEDWCRDCVDHYDLPNDQED